ncbi:MAG: DinB family protein [Actinomycetota bacterium]
MRSVTEEIVPDDKNWTWVLERRCDDCGFDAAAFDPDRTAPAIRDLGQRWAAVLAGRDVQVRPRPGVWSALEYGCHVRDVFLRFDGRLAAMLHEDDPHFENWDQDRTAIEDRYDLQHPATVAGEVIGAAEDLASRYGSVGDDAWDRRGFRSDGSVFTVASMARYLLHDPVHHLWDVGAEVPRY